MVNVDSMIFGMIVLAILIAVYRATYSATKYVIDRTNKDYTIIEFDLNGQRVCQKYTRKGYESMWIKHEKGGE